MKIVHVCDGWEKTNGAANIAHLLADEQVAAGAECVFRRWAGVRELRAADEVWVHCGWKPTLWWAVLWARFAVWVPEACYDPVRLGFHGWKKRLVSPIERFFLRRCHRIVATCAAEAQWVKDYLGSRCPTVEVTDIRRFFRANERPLRDPRHRGNRPLRILYLGRRHPLKGIEFLEAAVTALNARLPAVDGKPAVELAIVSNAFGAEKERVFEESDLLCLPTLSDNLGLVIAEGLQHGLPVVTTDGAPAWIDEPTHDAAGQTRFVYLKGYRAGASAERVSLLVDALMPFSQIA